MMNCRYEFGGLIVRSPFALDSVRPLGGRFGQRTADIELSLGVGPPPIPRQRTFSWPGRYGMRLWPLGSDWLLTSERSGSFWIRSEGRSVVCFRDARSSQDGFEEAIVRRVLPKAAMLQGFVPLHAAALTDGDGAYLLLGVSGVGKSTLCAALHRELGWDVWGDDTAILQEMSGVPFVSPSTVGVCLLTDSRENLSAASASVSGLAVQEEKVWCRIEDTKPQSPRPLKALLWLPPSETVGPIDPAPSSERVSARDGLLLLLRQHVRFNPFDRAMEERAFHWLSAVANAVPAYSLRFPRTYERLGDVAVHIQRLCATAPKEPPFA